MSESIFKIKTNYTLSDDQSRVVKQLCEGIEQNDKHQVLLGVTGSGKTFSMANVISKSSRPSIIITPNKTIAGQIYDEMKELFPENAVEFFVSYYDYYQPEVYIPKTDKYIEKDASINQNINMLRNSATVSLLTRQDCIVVSTVSCIYGLGSPNTYASMSLRIKIGEKIPREELLLRLIELDYERNDIDFSRGNFRIRGKNIDIFPSHVEKTAWRMSFNEKDELEYSYEFDPITLEKIMDLNEGVHIFPNTQYLLPRNSLNKVISLISEELEHRVDEFKRENKILEAQRLSYRTLMDIEMLRNTGHCKGIENYSRYFSGIKPGDPPHTLFSYLPKNGLCFVDESHVTVPQLASMYEGNKSRKKMLIDYGFRLKSAYDNRPMNFDEWSRVKNSVVFVSATPANYEIEMSQGKIVEQLIRPTGILDPICVIKPAKNQVEDLIEELDSCIKQGNRALVLTLTKKMSESVVEYLKDMNYKCEYLHSDVPTLDRLDIIKSLRVGEIDIIVGINLLREGLDIPECALVAILDADKEGFLRSEVSLIQTIGRCARNIDGKVVLYADKVTNSISFAIKETQRRRKIQEEYNKQHNIVPKKIQKSIKFYIKQEQKEDNKEEKLDISKDIFKSHKTFDREIKRLNKLMKDAANNLDFEEAKGYRDQISKLQKQASVLL